MYIWKIGISLFNERIQFLRTFLSHDEIDKADRYRFMEDTSRFVVSRAILRLVCGSCLSMNPEEIGFEYGKNGKPGIAGLYEKSPFLIFHILEISFLLLFPVTEIQVLMLN